MLQLEYEHFSAGLKCLEIFHGILSLKESQATSKSMDETFEVSFHNEGQEIRFEKFEFYLGYVKTPLIRVQIF